MYGIAAAPTLGQNFVKSLDDLISKIKESECFGIKSKVLVVMGGEMRRHDVTIAATGHIIVDGKDLYEKSELPAAIEAGRLFPLS